MLLLAAGSSLRAQQTAPPLPTQPETPAGDALPAQGPEVVTPEQQLEQQIRQVDPLDHSDDKDAKAREKADRDAEKKKADQDQAPTPGSIAAEQRNAAQAGPQVVSEDDSDQPVQEYTGPAVLSRSYSVSRPLIPQELKWSESAGISFVDDVGAAEAVNANGIVGSTNLVGAALSWSFSGRHYFRHDQVAVNYIGSYYDYPTNGGYSGSNNSIAVDYSHVMSRRMTLNVVMSGSLLSQNYTLGSEYLEPSTTIANINLSSSPNIQITDLGTKQFSTQADFVWQKSARLSFDGGSTYFGIERNTPGLLGMTGLQTRGDSNYRLNRQLTVGAYYSFSHYIFAQGFGNSSVNTVGAIYSYAFSRTMQLRVRGGASMVQSLGFQTITVAPAVAALLGQSSGYIDVASKTSTSDISAQLIRDFRAGRTASIAFAHGISPGNGLFQTSVQESFSASFGMPLFRVYSIQAAVGRDTLTAVAQALSGYESDYIRLSISHKIRRDLNGTFTATLRHFDLAGFIGLRNQVLLSAGINWGSTNGRLWPF